MTMRISQAGNNRAPTQIDNPSGVKFLRLVIGADENNAIAFYRNRLRFGLLLIDGVNVPVSEDEVGILSVNHCGERKPGDKEEEAVCQSRYFHIIGIPQRGSYQLPLQDLPINVDLPGLTAWPSFDVIVFANCLLFRIGGSDHFVFCGHEIESEILFCPRRADS